MSPTKPFTADPIAALRYVDRVLSLAADRGTRAKPSVAELNAILDVIRRAIAADKAS